MPKELFKDFKATNSRLRKLKVASHVCSELNKVNKRGFLYYSQNKPKNKLDIIVLQNGHVPVIDLDSADLQALLKQSKVDLNVLIATEQDFENTINKKKMYKYKFDTFFSYSTAYSRKKTIAELEKDEHMYSDIGVKITKI